MGEMADYLCEQEMWRTIDDEEPGYLSIKINNLVQEVQKEEDNEAFGKVPHISYGGVAKEIEIINALSDKEFIDYILDNSSKEKMDSVSKKFKPYSIAENIKKNDWTPSERQRKTIRSVYLKTL